MCTSSQKNTKNLQEKVSFHVFPNKETQGSRVRRWCNVIKKVKKDWEHPADLGREKEFWIHAVICSLHFEASCYTSKNFLNQTTAVPSILYPKSRSGGNARSTITSKRLDENVSFSSRALFYIETIQCTSFFSTKFNARTLFLAVVVLYTYALYKNRFFTNFLIHKPNGQTSCEFIKDEVQCISAYITFERCD